MERNDRAIAAFTMVAHAMFHTYELVIPIFVVVWLDAFPLDAAGFGIVVGAAYALTGLCALPSGALADRYRSKRLIVLCLVGMGVSFVLVSLASNVVVLTGALLLWGAAASIYHPAGLALISRGAKTRGTVFAYHGAAGNVGVAVGPLLAAVLLSFYHWRVVAATLVVPVLVALLLVSRLEFDERAGSQIRDTGTGTDDRDGVRTWAAFASTTKRLFSGGFVLAFGIAICYGIYYRGALTFLPDILAQVPVFEPVERFGNTFEPSQYVYSGLLLLGGVGQYAGGRLVDRVRAEYALVGTYGLLVALALVFVPATNAGLVPLLLIAGCFGIVVFGVAPINQEIISTHTVADVRGLSFGYTYAGVFGVGAAGATIAGVVLTYASPAVLFLVLAAFASGAVALGLSLAARS